MSIDDYPKCENCGGPLVPRDIEPVWVVTVRNDSLPNVRDEHGKCTACGRPLWDAPEEDDW